MSDTNDTTDSNDVYGEAAIDLVCFIALRAIGEHYEEIRELGYWGTKDLSPKRPSVVRTVTYQSLMREVSSMGVNVEKRARRFAEEQGEEIPDIPDGVLRRMQDPRR